MTGPRPTQLGGVGAMLSSTTWRELLELGMPRSYEQGAVLMRQGDQGNVVLALIHGRVKVFRSEPDGLELPLAVRYPGELLGEIAVVSDRRRTATVAAIDDCQVRAVSARRFQRFVEDNDLGPFLLRHSINRFQEAEQYRAELSTLPVFQLLCRALLRYADIDDGQAVVDLNMTQDEFGRLFGASRNAVSGALRRLRELGIVETSRRTMIIKDVAALITCADHGGPQNPPL